MQAVAAVRGRSRVIAVAAVVLLSVATVSALVLLVPAGFAPLSVASLGHARQGDLGLACALGTVLGALSLCAVGLYRRAVGRSGA